MREKSRKAEGTRHILSAMAVLLGVVVVGIVGYILIEDMTFIQALYMTVITISTVGFGEVTTLSTAGLYFTVFYIVIGVSAMLFFLATVFEFILSEYLGDIWGRRRMVKNISRLTKHYIVCGYGRVGRSVVEELVAKGKPLVVIEEVEETYRLCVNDGHLAIHGSATENDVLIEAGVRVAAGLVSALHTDADNLYVVLTARTMNPNLLLVARADQPGSEEKLEMVGADKVISPHHIAGKRMASLLLRPRVCEFLDAAAMGNIPGYELSELKIDENSPLKGKTIKGTRLRERTGITILAIRGAADRKYNSNPSPETPIEKGDVLIIIGTQDQMERLESERAAG